MGHTEEILMLSRVAESLYWMQRYRERAENMARLAAVNVHLSIDAPGDEGVQWFPVVAATGDWELYRDLHSEATEQKVLYFLTFDPRNPNSILNCLHQSRENARSIRPIITSEMWHELNTVYLYIQKAAKRAAGSAPGYEFYDNIRKSCQLLTGITDTTLSHGEAWHFARLGNLLERADQASRILDVKYYMLLPSAEHVGTAYDDIQWAAVLKSAGALEMYRRIHHSIHHSSVAEFLILNRQFPRAIYSCLHRAEDSMRRLMGGKTENCRPYALISAMCEDFSRISIYEIIKKGMHEFLDNIQARIIGINDSIYSSFFGMAPAPPREVPEESMTNA